MRNEPHVFALILLASISGLIVYCTYGCIEKKDVVQKKEGDDATIMAKAEILKQGRIDASLGKMSLSRLYTKIQDESDNRHQQIAGNYSQGEKIVNIVWVLMIGWVADRIIKAISWHRTRDAKKVR